MDFEFTPEQQQIADMVQRFVAKDYSFETRRLIKNAAPGWSREMWHQLAELGLLAINIPEEHGGMGGGPTETMLVMNAFGQGLLLEPYLASAVVATALLRRVGDEQTVAELLPAMASGERIVVVAHDEPGARGDIHHVTTRAAKSGDGYLLSGAKCVISHGDAADELLLSARTAGGSDDVTGISLFRVARDTPGLNVRGYETLDGLRAAEITLRNAYVPRAKLLGRESQANGQIAAALDIGLAAVCAEAVGAMKALIDATVEYLKTRQQFGVPIGKFQALQHRMVDMLIHFEQAKSMSYLAAIRCEEKDEHVRRRALSAAKVVVGQACRFIAQQAVQLHGGMGVTDELNVSHYFKRLTAIEMSFGDTDHHLEQFIAVAAAQ